MDMALNNPQMLTYDYKKKKKEAIYIYIYIMVHLYTYRFFQPTSFVNFKDSDCEL